MTEIEIINLLRNAIELSGDGGPQPFTEEEYDEMLVWLEKQDRSSYNNDKETHYFFQHGQAQMLAAICEYLRVQWGIGENDINQLKGIFSPYEEK